MGEIHEITLYACLVKSVELSNLVVELGGRIGQIGWKSIEIMPGRIAQIWWLIGWKSIEIMPGQISRIWWLNWVEIH